jgi:5-(carboxyamino)imidazole ribonucleotide synthase
MVNLLGEAGFEGEARYEGLDKLFAISGTYVHLYGKKITKPFRKMGHITITDPNFESLRRKIELVKNSIKVKA